MSGSVVAARISKRYGPVRALEDVSAEFRPGEVHCVLGENGAGKSTLASVLSGFATPDGGTACLGKLDLSFGDPAVSKRAGIEMIHQHFMLVPEFTVAENLALAALGTTRRWVRSEEAAGPGLAIAEKLGWEFDPSTKVRNLPVGLRQRLEIVKALASDAQVVIFDEPTAVLAQDEVEELFRVMARLRDEGRILILVAHKLSEVMAIADRVTVLRRGKKVAEAARGGFTADQLAEWMVGELPAAPAREGQPAGEGLTVRNLHVRGDRGEPAVRGASFQVRRGEVLGIGGVDGNGQLELAEAVAQVRPAESGTVSWSEPTFRVGYIPQDRRNDGLALEMTVAENMLLTGYHRDDLRRGPFLRVRAIPAWVRGLIERFGIDAPETSAPVSSLSGGNQQKVVVARVLDSEPDLLVVSGPTRGLDVRATAYVREQILVTKKRGAAVLLVSADLDELVEVSDRVLFMSRGELIEGEAASAVVGGQG